MKRKELRRERKRKHWFTDSLFFENGKVERKDLGKKGQKTERERVYETGRY